MNELIIKGVNIPFQINIQTVNEYIKEASTNIELAKKSKQEQEKQGNKLSYNNYTALIKFIKNREEESDSIVNKIKNKELEDIEAVLTDFKGYLRVWRLDLEKEQKKYKEEFLLDSKIQIKKRIESMVDDVCIQLPTIFKGSNYNDWVTAITIESMKGFSGVKAESLPNTLQSILNDMALASQTQALINNIYNVINQHDILNSGVVVDMFDYFNIDSFDILVFAERKKQEAQLILQKQQEARQRELLLKQKQEEEDSYTVRDSYNELLEFVKDSVVGLQARTPILKEIWSRRDSGVINDSVFINYIKDKVDCVNGKRTTNIINVEPVKQEEPQPQNTGYITKDYYFENEADIKRMNELLKEWCRFRTIEVSGTKRKVITGFIN